VLVTSTHGQLPPRWSLTKPSWRIIPASSRTPQCSAICPLATRMMCICLASNRLPVGGAAQDAARVANLLTSATSYGRLVEADGMSHAEPGAWLEEQLARVIPPDPMQGVGIGVMHLLAGSGQPHQQV